MSKRQPTIKIDDQIIAHDEIVGVIDFNQSPASAGKQKPPFSSAIKLVDGTIMPLPAHKINSVITFLFQNEQ